MIKSVKSIVINRPIEDVWKFMTNLQNVFDWDPEFLDIQPAFEGSAGVGSMVRYQRRFLGVLRKGVFQVSEHSLNSVLAIQVSEGGITGEIRYTFEAVEGGTRLTGASKGQLAGWWKLLTPYLTSMLEREGLEDLVRVKRLMEAQP